MALLSSNNNLTATITVNKQGTGIQDTEKDLTQLNKTAGETTEKTGGLTSAFGSFANTLKTVGMAYVGYQIVQQTEKMFSTVISAAGGLEQTNIAFQSLIGNVDLANNVFGQLVQYANTTPFESKDIETAANTLLGFGTAGQQTVDIIKQLGDVVSVGGGDLQSLSLVTGQIFSQGKLRAQDMYQVINDGGAGLIKIMAKNVGGMKNLTAEFDTGGIPAQQYFDAVTEATKNGGFAFQGAQKEADTFNGRLSTLKDSATQFGLSIIGVKLDPKLGLTIQPGGLFDRMKDGMSKLTVFFQNFGPIAGDAIGKVVGGFGDALHSVENYFGGLLNWKIVLSDIKTAFNDISGVVSRDLVPPLKAVQDWFKDLPPVVQLAVSPLGAFVTNIHNLSQFSRDVIVSVHNMWDAFKASTPVIIIGQFFTQVFIPALKAIWAAFVQNLLPALKQLWDAFTRLWAALNPALIDALKILGVIVGGLLLAAIWAALSVINLLVQAFSFVISIVSNLIDWLSNLIGWFGNVIGTVKNVIGAIIDIFKNLIPAVSDVIGTVVDIFAQMGSMIINAIGDATKWLYNIGKDIIKGLINGIEDAVSGVGSAIGKVAGDIGGAVKGALHTIHVPGFYTGVQNFAGGLAMVGDVPGGSGELVNLPQGSSVYSNSQSKAMMRQGSGGNSVTNHIYVTLSSGGATREFFNQINNDGLLANKGLTVRQGS